MSKKNTQLKFLAPKLKIHLFLIVCCFFSTVAIGQTTVVDFENPSDYQHLAWNGTAEVVANPNSSGINTSTNVGKYTIPAGSAWSNASVVIINTPLNLKDLSSLEFSVIAPSGTQMYSKLELDGVGGVAEAYATPVAGANWQKLTFNFTALGGVDVNTATYDKFTFFFNVNDNVGGEVWYFDDVVVNSNSLDVETAISSDFKVFPNPVNDVLSFKSASSFDTNLNTKIYDISGALVKEFKGANTNVEQLKSGMYVMAIETKEGLKRIEKFIKK